MPISVLISYQLQSSAVMNSHLKSSAPIHSHKFTFAMLSSALINSLKKFTFAILSFHNFHSQCSAVEKFTFTILCCILKKCTFVRLNYHKFTIMTCSSAHKNFTFAMLSSSKIHIFNIQLVKGFIHNAQLS